MSEQHLFDVSMLVPARERDRERKVTQLVEALRQHPEWQPDDLADRRLAVSLLEAYPTVDLPSAVAKWVAWMAEHRAELPKEVNLVARIKRWCRNDREWAAPSGRRQGAGVRRTRTAPRSAGDFGEADGSIGTW
jgi:hypothetical protein